MFLHICPTTVSLYHCHLPIFCPPLLGRHLSNASVSQNRWFTPNAGANVPRPFQDYSHLVVYVHVQYTDTTRSAATVTVRATPKTTSMALSYLDGLFECTQLLGTVPALSEDELVEAMQQIVGGVEGIGAKKITEATEFGLEELVVWWLDGM